MSTTREHPGLRDDPAPAAVEPVMMTDTYVELGGKNLRCLCESVALVPDLNPITVTTFCGVQDYPGPVKWHMTATFVQAFGEGGTDDALSEGLAAYLADGTKLAYKVRPYASRPVSPTNPEFYGELIPDYYQPFGGDAGSESTVEIDWTMDGAPQRDIGDAVLNPNLATVTPNTGDTGDTVALAGSNFAANMTVAFGAAAATNVVRTTSAAATCTVPAGVGTVDVVVTNPGAAQVGRLADGFEYT